MIARDPFSKSGLFDRSLRRILRPLVRALIAQGVTAPALYNIVKQTYVDVASHQLGDAATDSRINVMTGVHRRDVKEFRNRDPSEDTGVSSKVSILSSVVGRWLSEPTYLRNGDPAPLMRFGTEPPSFETLVQSVSRDIRPRTVLDELLRQGVVTLGKDHVKLVLDGLVGAADTDQKLHFFAQNLGDHMQASVDNLLSETSPHMERAVYYNSLSAQSITDIEKEARKLGNDTLRKINSLAVRRQSQDVEQGSGAHRFRFGLFFYKEDEDAKEQGTMPDDDQ
ncbi:DUF6502 family protein [Roseobacter sp.]|uniref:DUF6502 family protein n=1 Tax=Roseobacter sp. TaxID=1907202 RepID=UPI0038580A87